MNSTVHCTGTMVLSMFVAHVVGTHVSAQVVPDLEVHFTFDDENEPELDSSGNDRHSEIDGAQWVDDPEREGALEFLGGNDGFVRVEIPELPGDDFTIAFWVYRDSLTAGLNPNDGLFQVQLGGAAPTRSATDKVIGGWVGQDNGAWGRIHQADRTRVNLDRGVLMMDVDSWMHFAYRGDGEMFELVVNGESGVGPFAFYNGTLDVHDTLFIGKQGGTESWGGRIDDFRVYSRALSDEEIELAMSDLADMEPEGPLLLRGDCNEDGKLDLADPIANLSYQFLGEGRTCLDALDFDDSGEIDVSDPISSLTHQFLGGPPPAPPGKETCGVDPTDDELSCDSFAACPGGG